MSNTAKRFVVIGLGQFGSNVALRLVEQKCDVLAIDVNEERVQELSDRIPHAVVADATHEKVLHRLGVADYDVAIISCGDALETSILATAIIREIGVREIIVKANSKTHGRILERLGATRVIYPEEERAVQLANQLVHPDVLQEIALSPEYILLEINTPEPIAGKSIIDSAVRSKYGVSILAVRTNEILPDGSVQEKLLVTPEPSYIPKPQDKLIIVGRTENIKKFTEAKK